MWCIRGFIDEYKVGPGLSGREEEQSARPISIFLTMLNFN